MELRLLGVSPTGKEQTDSDDSEQLCQGHLKTSRFLLPVFTDMEIFSEICKVEGANICQWPSQKMGQPSPLCRNRQMTKSESVPSGRSIKTSGSVDPLLHGTVGFLRIVLLQGQFVDELPKKKWCSGSVLLGKWLLLMFSKYIVKLILHVWFIKLGCEALKFCIFFVAVMVVSWSSGLLWKSGSAWSKSMSTTLLPKLQVSQHLSNWYWTKV